MKERRKTMLTQKPKSSTIKVNKILLIQPPSVTIKGERKICQVPLGLGYISANVNEEYDIKVIDAIVEGYDHEVPMGEEYIIFGLPFRKIREEIVQYEPDMVAISIQSTAFYLNGLAIAKITKHINKDIIVSVGGAYPSADYKKVIDSEFIDYIMIGEGEESFNELLEALNEKRKLNDVDGLIYKDSNKKVIMNPKRNYITDLDSLRSPFTKLQNVDRYFKINSAHFETKSSRATHMITSRGCPNDCDFCTIHDVWGYKYRMRSTENVLEEVAMLKEKYDITEIHFEDDNIAYNEERAIEIFKGLKKYNIKWGLPNGISLKTINKDLLKLMKESGCYTMALPFESASQNTLQNIIHKYVDLEHGANMVKEATKLGIETYGFFIVGFPGETMEDIRQTMEYSAGLGLTGIYIFYATPFPGTQLLKQVVARGYMSDDKDLFQLTIERPSFGTKNFTVEDLWDYVEGYKNQMRKKGYNYL